MEIAIEITFQCDIVVSVGVLRLKTTNKEIEIVSLHVSELNWFSATANTLNNLEFTLILLQMINVST